MGVALAKTALSAKAEAEADAFGRSAFNRFYYAAYLVTRGLLKELDAKWAREPHGKIPSLLSVTVLDRIRKGVRAAEAGGLVSSGQASSIRRQAAIAAADLASLLNTAQQVRVVADYDPETRILRQGHMIKLSDHSIDEAEGWRDRASACCGTIQKVWRELGLG